MKKNKIYNIGKVLALVAFGFAVKSVLGSSEYNQCIVDPVTGLLVVGGIASSLFGKKKSKAAPPPKPVDIFAKKPIYGKGKNKKKIIGYKKNLVEKQTTGISNYYTNQVPGLSAISRETMRNLSPEQAAAVERAGLQVGEAQKLRQGFDLNLAGAMSKYGSVVGDYKPTISQEQANQLYDTSMAQTMAQEAFNRRGALSGEEQRAAQQQAREAAAASGRIGGNAAFAAEIQNREAARAARRAEAASAGGMAYEQGLNALRQRFETQQGLFNQNLGIGQQQAAERQLGFNQFLTGEQQRSGLLDQEMKANTVASGLAQDFYTTPGLNMLALPLNFANQAAGATNQYNKDKYAVDAANQQAKAKMFSDIGSTLMGAGMSGGLGTSLGNFGSFLGSGNMGNASTAFSNIGLGSLGQPLKAYTV
jgi:hypothetical protein